MTVFDRAGGTQPAPVLWTRGSGCAELAALLSDTEPVRVVGDLTEECIRHRADLLVSRRLSGFDLVSLAVPIDFDPDRVEFVVAAVAGGPHSPLAARVARRLGKALDLPSFMACAYRDEEGREHAVSLIEDLYKQVPGLEYRLVEAIDAQGLISGLPSSALLIIGAPGGNWFQRTIFGQGAKLRQKAPAGAVMVQRSAPRVFHLMSEPVFVGPLREAADILRMHDEEVLAVADQGKLVGIVRREVLLDAPPEAPVVELMEEPQSVLLATPVEDAFLLSKALGPAPIPVTDDEENLVGSLLLPG